MVIAAMKLKDSINGEEHRLLARLLVYEITLRHFEAHELVAPPSEAAVAWNHAAVVSTAKVEILKCKLLHRCRLLCYGLRNAQYQHSK